VIYIINPDDEDKNGILAFPGIDQKKGYYTNLLTEEKIPIRKVEGNTAIEIAMKPYEVMVLIFEI